MIYADSVQKSRLEASRYSPKNGNNSVSLSGPKILCDQIAKRQQQRKPKAQNQNLPTNKNKLQELEFAIAVLREKIKSKNEARNNTNNSSSNKPEEDSWKVEIKTGEFEQNKSH
jgi:hypothetical protein